ncbi:hypothetical protein [Vibrio parahaemolyticus]|uniref:hypothetical protein n=1 Tax=Vibrio parahaemolyticus TaxID=670 RepID=UPI001E45268C|nr:hypothetical protein [Vibrio parahaemolyticus]
MSKRVNFSRHLEIQWLDQTARWVASGLDKATLNENVDRMLEPHIKCKVNKGKTRNQLINLWFSVSSDMSDSFQNKAIEFVKSSDELPLSLHWGQLVAKNVFFSDVARFVGRKLKHGDSFTYAQAQKHLVELYGDTETVKRALRSALKTLVEFRLVSRESNRSYSVNKLEMYVDTRYKSWLLLALMYNQGFHNRSLSNLLDDLVWFPFDFSVSFNEIDALLFELHQQGNELVLFRKER